MDKALEFFEQAIGRPATSAEQTGNISLPILLQLIDARVMAIAEETRTEEPAPPAPQDVTSA